MRANRWLGAGLIVLGVAVAACVLLGPLVFEVIRYRTSPTTLNQIIGTDAAALLLVAPASILAGILTLRRHPVAPVLALAPSIFASYTYTQLIVGQEYLRLPGNNERFFPLLLGIFILAGALTLRAWDAIDPARLPARSRRADRVTAGLLLALAGFVVVMLHLPALADAMRAAPTSLQYRSSPTPFWLVRLMDLGIVVPILIAVAVGLLQGTARARKALYAIVGGYALLGASVAGMAITMYASHDPDASLGMVVAATLAALAIGSLAAVIYQPLFALRATPRAAAHPSPAEREPATTPSRP